MFTTRTYSQFRFHKLIWGSHGMGQESENSLVSGVLVGGFDEGVMKVFDANKVLNKGENPVVLTKNKHTGPVRALDFNSFRVSQRVDSLQSFLSEDRLLSKSLGLFSRI